MKDTATPNSIAQTDPTTTTSATSPTAAASPPQDAKQSEEHSTRAQSVDSAASDQKSSSAPAVKSSETLPASSSAVRWEEVLSDTKERYYHELATGRTQWELPTDGWVELLRMMDRDIIGSLQATQHSGRRH